MIHCKSKTKGGKPCASTAVGADGYCFTHSPGQGRARAAAHRLGGQHRRRVPNESPYPSELNVKDLKGLSALIEQVIKDTWVLGNSVARSRTLGYLAMVEKAMLEAGELEARLAALEYAFKMREEE